MDAGKVSSDPVSVDEPDYSIQIALLAAIVASSDDAIVSKTLEGRILSWNAGAERIFGYTAAEAIGQPITIIIPPEHLAEEKRILDQVSQHLTPLEPSQTQVPPSVIAPTMARPPETVPPPLAK